MSQWPAPRIPDEDWTRQPLGELALKYDTVEHHGWYSNLEPTVEALDALLQPGHALVDYSGGTGILAERLLARLGSRPIRIVIVDSSPKFLRLAVEKLRDEPRVAFRLIRWLKDEKRLQALDEVLEEPLVGAGLDALVSTNAIHLYDRLGDTLASWARVLRAGAAVHVQSGNIATTCEPGEWIIDDTVEAIHARAMELVRQDESLASWRGVLDDPQRMAGHDAVRRKYFLPVRPLQHYVQALEAAGFEVLDVSTRRIEARVDEWRDFLAVYHDGVLGWIGGTERVEGAAADESAVQARLAILDRAMRSLFAGGTFPCRWTYLTARRRPS